MYGPKSKNYRKYGEVQPYIPLGPFQLRIPFVHFRFEAPDALQGLLLIAIPMSSITAHQEMLGIPFELAIIMVTLNSLLYNVHVCLGDPVSAGWITPAIPLIGAWGQQFEPGVERIHATLALGYFMGFLFLFLGITKLGNKINALIPRALRIGIIMGAGVASVISVAGTRMVGKEISVLAGLAISFVTMFSPYFLSKVKTNAFVRVIAKYGMLPGMVCACIVAYIFKEVEAPVWDLSVVPLWRWGELLQGYTAWGLGFPSASMFVKCIPMVISCYIIAFGDFVFVEVIMNEANEKRPDEELAYDVSRNYMICGFRNCLLATFAPYGAVLSGPLWGATHVSVLERYKQGREEMDSIFGGFWSMNCFLFFGTIWQGIVSFFKPCLQVAMSVTMMVQSWACFYIAIEACESRMDRAVGGVIAIFLAVKGATFGLFFGIGLCIVMGIIKDKSQAQLDAILEGKRGAEIEGL